MFRRSPEVGVLYIENDFHGSGVNRIDSCLFSRKEKLKRWGLFRYSRFNIHHIFYSGEVFEKPMYTWGYSQFYVPPQMPRVPGRYYVILTLERRDGIGGQALSTPLPTGAFYFIS